MVTALVEASKERGRGGGLVSKSLYQRGVFADEAEGLKDLGQPVGLVAVIRDQGLNRWGPVNWSSHQIASTNQHPISTKHT